jgi:endonuclease/exonuclease/phosphatase family metal-dependent hydrolase
MKMRNKRRQVLEGGDVTVGERTARTGVPPVMDQRDKTEGWGGHIRIATYNVHGCRGTDGRIDPLRIAEVLTKLRVDVVALQELDSGRSRSGGMDQAQAIASHMRMHFHFHAVYKVQGGEYGNAILSAWPLHLVQAASLPSLGEPRGALWASVALPTTNLEIITAHLGLRRRERAMQIAALAGAKWLKSVDLHSKPTILLGDLNALPSSIAYRMLARQFDYGSPGGGPTFPSRFPLLKLDHVLSRNGPRIVSQYVPKERPFRSASDHLPLVAEVEFHDSVGEDSDCHVPPSCR